MNVVWRTIGLISPSVLYQLYRPCIQRTSTRPKSRICPYAIPMYHDKTPLAASVPPSNGKDLLSRRKPIAQKIKLRATFPMKGLSG